MAKVNGIVPIKGTIKKLSFYKRNGVDLVRAAAGPSAQQMRKRKSMRSQRQNINEFYHAASPAAKVLRVALTQMKHLWHMDVSGMLAALFRRIILLEEGAPGERSLRVLAHKAMLEDFSFHPERSFEEIVQLPYSIEMNFQRTETTLTIPAFDPATSLTCPEDATHLRFLFGITALSEYVFDANAKPYEPKDHRANGKQSIMESTLISIGTISSPVSLKASLPAGIKPASGTAVIVALGIEFQQEVNGKMYRLKEGGFMKNLNVY